MSIASGRDALPEGRAMTARDVKIDTVRLIVIPGQYLVEFERGLQRRQYMIPDTDETTVRMLLLGSLVKRLLPEIVPLAHGWVARKAPYSVRQLRDINDGNSTVDGRQ